MEIYLVIIFGECWSSCLARDFGSPMLGLGKKVETCLVKKYRSVLGKEKGPSRVSLHEAIHGEMRLSDKYRLCGALSHSTC